MGLTKSYATLQKSDAEPGARLRWQRCALVLIGEDKITATAVYDAVTRPKFVANWSDEHRAQLGKLLQANLHMFSFRQQRAVLVGVPLADAVAAQSSASRGNDPPGGSAAGGAGAGSRNWSR